MIHFAIRFESDSGECVEFVPRYVKPLGLGALRSLLLDDTMKIGVAS
jgi:hypothetical protein